MSELSLRARVSDRGLDLSLDVAAGETVALLGPNGAGKSSVLAVVAGLLRPDTGEVVVDGRTLSSARVSVAPHDRRVALLAQEPLLFPHLSVLDNVAFGPRSSGVRRGAARATALHWLRELEADDLAARRPTELSGGQAQRVAIARALATDPKVLLLDEPMAALDVAVAPALRRTLRRVLADRTTLVVTHDVLDALLLADRVVVLEDGRVVEEGVTAEVLTRPRSRFAARIAGLNLVAGTWADGRVVTESGLAVAGLASTWLTAGSPVVAVFRPAAVAVFHEAPGGSPRNVWDVVVTDLEPRGDVVRVHAGDLAADITLSAAAELDLVPGARVLFSVKATEVAVHPR